MTSAPPPDLHKDRLACGRRPVRAFRAAGVAGLLAAVAALAAVFASYLDPHLALDIANRIWACF